MADIVVLHPDAVENRRLRTIFRNEGYRCKGIYHISGAMHWLAQSHQKSLLVLPVDYFKPISAHLYGEPVLLLSNDGHIQPCTGLKCTISAESENEQLLHAAKVLLSNSACMRSIGNLCLNTVTGEVTFNQKPLKLTTTESALLQVLMENPDEAISREELLTRAWGYSCGGITRTVDVHVQRLRKKLGKSSIETVYRSGYKLATV